MTENFPGLVKDISLQIQETQWTPPNRKNTEKIVTRHVIIKLLKTKDGRNGSRQILKDAILHRWKMWFKWGRRCLTTRDSEHKGGFGFLVTELLWILSVVIIMTSCTSQNGPHIPLRANVTVCIYKRARNLNTILYCCPALILQITSITTSYQIYFLKISQICPFPSVPTVSA